MAATHVKKIKPGHASVCKHLILLTLCVHVIALRRPAAGGVWRDMSSSCLMEDGSLVVGL